MASCGDAATQEALAATAILREHLPDLKLRFVVPRLQEKASHVKEKMKNEIILNLAYAHEHGADRKEIADWVWPY